ncbi:MAG: hypothetical protein ACREP4_03610 [Stenotrophomonas sp.]|uniref:hypothetical protein n=1 Tax=Stenotrophomonas sp. TaxID=69392 RepID=UPI003D6C970A
MSDFCRWRAVRHVSVGIAAALVVAGCCDQNAIDECRKQERQAAAMEAAGITPFLAEVNGGSRVDINSDVQTARCHGGRSRNAEVKLTWQVIDPEITGVRIKVGSAGAEPKVWMESGAAGEGVTGPWIDEGSRLIFEDQKTGEVLAEVIGSSLPCKGG